MCSLMTVEHSTLLNHQSITKYGYIWDIGIFVLENHILLHDHFTRLGSADIINTEINKTQYALQVNFILPLHNQYAGSSMHLTSINTHTYIMGHYNPLDRIVCINFIYVWWNLQLKVGSKRQIFESLFHDRFIYCQNFCQKSVERKSHEEIFFFTFRFDV